VSAEGWAEALLWVAILLPPLLLPAFAKEAFRLPKLLASEWLGLASLLPLALRIRSAERVGGNDLGRIPALVAVGPLLAVATLGLAVGRHPFHLHEALVDLWIGAACLVGWNAGLSRERLGRLLRGLLVPATALALLGILQFHGLYRPFQFEGTATAGRLAVTSLAGNPGDLAAYLVLPCLLGQWALVREWANRRRAPALAAIGAALGICLYAMAVTQTLSALASVAAGSLVLWACLAPRRLLAPAAGLGVGLAVVLVLAVPPLRGRVMEKAGKLAQGDWNSLLTGRLDGWRTAAWMLRQHPLTGAGPGGFETEFVPAKLALLEDGVRFFASAVDVTFENAHNEILDVGAELGVPGLLALGWGMWILWRALRRRSAGNIGDPGDPGDPGDSGDSGDPGDPGDTGDTGDTAGNARDAGNAGSSEEGRPGVALAWGGTAALALLSLFQFPFRIALTAFPALLFLAWVFGGSRAGDAEERERTGFAGRSVSGTSLGWLLAAVVVAALVFQGYRWRDRLLASALLRQVELVSISAATSGHAPGNLLPAHLELLRRAAALDPSEVGIPIARGSQFLLFGDPRAAIPEYRAALALQPKPEIYSDLGRAYLASGDLEEARRNFRLAVRLDPTLASQLPEEMR
jgi:O-antigen ligase